MAKLAELAVSLELQSKAFQQGVDKANRSLDRMARQSKKSSTAMVGLQKSFANIARLVGPMAIALASAFSVRSVKSAIDFADALAKMGSAVGFATDELQQLQFASERSGIATSQFNSNMTAFVKRVGEAKNGMGPLVSGLKNMDQALLSALQNSENQSEALDLIADAIQGAGSATERAAIANAAFSRSGVAMVNVLRDGAAGLAELKQEAQDAGAVMDEALVATATVIKDKWDTLTDVIGVKFKSALIVAAEATLRFFDVFTDLPELQAEILVAQEELNAALFAVNNSAGPGSSEGRLKNARERLEMLKEEEKGLLRIKQLEDLRNAGPVSGPTGIPTIVITGINEADAALIAYEKSVLSATLATTLIGDKVKILHRLMLDGAISQEAYNAELFKFAQVAGEEAPAALDAMAVAAGNLAASGIKDMVDGFVEGQQSFSGLVETFLKGIAKMIIQQLVFNAIAGTAFGSFLGVSAPAAVNPAPTAGLFSGSNAGPQLFTGQGGRSATPSGTRSGTVVNVNNYASAEVEVNETKNSNGETSIDVKISDMVRREIKRGGFDRQNRAVYGLSRVGY